MDKPKLLIVDDDEELRGQMRWALDSEYEVALAGDRASAVESVRNEHPVAVTLDLGLPPAPGEVREGFLALSEMLQIDSLLKIVVITGQGEKDNALRAIGEGAYDFFSKPIDIEVLKVVLSRAAYLSRLEREHRDLIRNLEAKAFGDLIGNSPQMQSVFTCIRKVATTDAAVLVTGESGTGKEIAARTIHWLSQRRNAPFVAINCSAIPETLLESELFGHEKGSFTGAHTQRAGRIEAAQGGTLFLDEIGELPPALQVKLLRFLQEKQIDRVGGRKPITVDARVITATNTDLRKAMAETNFREDLYYRISVVTIPMPPVRERDGDIQLLAKVLLQRFASEQSRNVNFSRAAMEAIEAHSWPGNVREMENRIKRAVIMAEGNQITPEDLELAGEGEPFTRTGLAEAREVVEKRMIERAMLRNRGNLTRCAEELKISRPTLYELIDKLGISRK